MDKSTFFRIQLFSLVLTSLWVGISYAEISPSMI